jgi:hypothetical protein
LQKPQSEQNFKLLRNALLALITPDSGTMEQTFERYTLFPSVFIALIASVLWCAAGQALGLVALLSSNVRD